MCPESDPVSSIVQIKVQLQQTPAPPQKNTPRSLLNSLHCESTCPGFFFKPQLKIDRRGNKGYFIFLNPQLIRKIGERVMFFKKSPSRAQANGEILPRKYLLPDFAKTARLFLNEKGTKEKKNSSKTLMIT